MNFIMSGIYSLVVLLIPIPFLPKTDLSTIQHHYRFLLSQHSKSLQNLFRGCQETIFPPIWQYNMGYFIEVHCHA